MKEKEASLQIKTERELLIDEDDLKHKEKNPMTNTRINQDEILKKKLIHPYMISSKGLYQIIQNNVKVFKNHEKKHFISISRKIKSNVWTNNSISLIMIIFCEI